MSNHPFKVGDIVTGKPKNGYRFTSSVAKMKVTTIFGNGCDIEIQILNNPEYRTEEGRIYIVLIDKMEFWDESKRLFGLAKFVKLQEKISC